MKKTDQNALQQVLVDNFLKTQNVMNLIPGGKLVGGHELKSMPSSPGGPNQLGLKNRTRQLQLSNAVANNKQRRLTSSVSSSNIPDVLNKQSFTPQNCYNTVKQSVIGSQAASNAPTIETGNNIDATNSTKQHSSELAKIQATSAFTLDHDKLIT